MRVTFNAVYEYNVQQARFLVMTCEICNMFTYPYLYESSNLQAYVFTRALPSSSSDLRHFSPTAF